MTFPYILKKNNQRFSHCLVLGYVFSLLFIAASPGYAQAVKINYPDSSVSIGAYSSYFIDTAETYTAANILSADRFEKSAKKIPVFGVLKGNIWVNFSVTNSSADSVLFFDLQYSNISELEFYELKNNSLQLLSRIGNSIRFDDSRNIRPFFTVKLPLKRDESATFFLKVKSKHQVLLPMFIESELALNSRISLQNVIIGSYIGIILAILLYNLFLFISTRDRSYLVYVTYLFFLGLSQIVVPGYGYQYLWPKFPMLNDYILIVSSALAGISGIRFAQIFLHINLLVPKVKSVLFGLIAIFLLGILLSFVGRNDLGYDILNYTSLAGAIILIVISGYIARVKKFKPAYFYFVAWVSFLGGLIIFVMRNVSIVEYNNFTTYILYVGSAIEAILLSIALGDKINILQKEKELSQAEALKISLENEKLIKEQNIVLEQKVNERTVELQHANQQLNGALTNLKDAQAQLVDAEKMASLGQLTAGIAHEINNPINFVKSNIKPLQLDFRDLEELIDEYNKLHNADEKTFKTQLKNIADFQQQIDLPFVKTEINSLIKGIEEGAERTAEIVRGLRTFSRLDEGELKTVSVHEGIDSTLVLLKNSFPYNIKIIKDYQADGNIDCYPGKLNQVFMNIINNGIQAIQAKETKGGDESITITTKDVGGDRIIISIKDTGVGMTEEVKQKIFEPFFTTKAVGEGTGLGMAIVFKIIEKHNGKIDIISTPGNGAEFTLSLPHALLETSQNPR